MSRSRADPMPAVPVPPRLNGLPIATTHSPRRSLSESPNLTALSGFSGLTSSSARAGFWARPIRGASSRVPPVGGVRRAVPGVVAPPQGAVAVLIIVALPVVVRPAARAAVPRPVVALAVVAGRPIVALAAPVLEEFVEEF